jgi:hypothetical protein
MGAFQWLLVVSPYRVVRECQSGFSDQRRICVREMLLCSSAHAETSLGSNGKVSRLTELVGVMFAGSANYPGSNKVVLAPHELYGAGKNLSFEMPVRGMVRCILQSGNLHRRSRHWSDGCQRDFNKRQRSTNLDQVSQNTISAGQLVSL